jgi:capsular polysaccharide biosynthesis protein
MTSTEDGRPTGWRSVFDRPASRPPAPKPWDQPSAWNIPDVAPEEPDNPVRPFAALVSIHYLRNAIRRRWLRFALPAVLGLLLAGAYLAVNPAMPTASATLMLTHDQNADPNSAMATDISLLTTRTVAQQTIGALGLSMTPQQLLGTLTPVSTGSAEVLQLTMTGPDNTEATRRLDAFSRAYLQFRAQQLGAQADILISGYERRIADLDTKVQAATAQIQQLAAQGQSQTDTLSDAVTNRSRLTSQISDLQQQVQEAKVQRASVVAASKVIDPAAPVRMSHIKRPALILLSGLIGGLALGLVVVILQALLSDRLWLRIEVASALDTRVPLSVRRLAPLSWFWRPLDFLPRVKRLRTARSAERQRMADVLVQTIPGPGRRQALALLCLGNAEEVRFGVLTAASVLQRSGVGELVVDLTNDGVVQPALRRLGDLSERERPHVFRPSVVPSLTRGPADLEAADWDDVAVAKARNGVTLILADLDPAVGVDHLAAWSDDVVVAVTAGASSVELVRTAGDLIRSVGLRLRGAVLLRAVRGDMSSGMGLPEGEVDLSVSRAVAPRVDGGVERSLLS